ncbi:hypothetical protein F5Y17DRAFT_461991 [Xylariaceae sp. FL0594]|nr:hypothetical protein F5Y17DRAFT_461991 [Xylariaceae sp. FL0594]
MPSQGGAPGPAKASGLRIVAAGVHGNCVFSDRDYPAEKFNTSPGNRFPSHSSTLLQDTPGGNKSRHENQHDRSRQTLQQATWNEYDLKKTITGSRPLFVRFKVVRITHVKNLESWIWHKYLQVIVRDSVTSKLLRLIAERQTGNDHVLTGIWSPRKEGDTPPDGSADTRFPLALFTLEFNSNPISLESFVSVLSAVRAVRPKYNFLTANCYWYALCVYKSLYTKYKSTATQRAWTWWLYRGIPPAITSWFDLTSVFMKVAASKFKIEDMKDPNNPKYFPGHNGLASLIPLAVKFWEAIQEKMIGEHDSSDTASEVPNLHAKSVTALEIEARLLHGCALANMPNPVTHPTGDIREAHPFTDQVLDVCKDILQNPSRDQYLDKATSQGFDQVFTPLRAENIPPEFKEIMDKMDPGSRLTTAKDCDEFNAALKVSVGEVLTRLDEEEAAAQPQ